MPDSLDYEHVQLVAKVLPSQQAIDAVERIARSFWAQHPDHYIAIHCAYGALLLGPEVALAMGLLLL
jgi:alpha-glucan,water dikinase